MNNYNNNKNNNNFLIYKMNYKLIINKIKSKFFKMKKNIKYKIKIKINN
jgi:hypothetical protein